MNNLTILLVPQLLATAEYQLIEWIYFVKEKDGDRTPQYVN